MLSSTNSPINFNHGSCEVCFTLLYHCDLQNLEDLQGLEECGNSCDRLGEVMSRGMFLGLAVECVSQVSEGSLVSLIMPCSHEQRAVRQCLNVDAARFVSWAPRNGLTPERLALAPGAKYG
jgi:hypothetical protein